MFLDTVPELAQHRNHHVGHGLRKEIDIANVLQFRQRQVYSCFVCNFVVVVVFKLIKIKTNCF